MSLAYTELFAASDKTIARFYERHDRLLLVIFHFKTKVPFKLAPQKHKLGVPIDTHKKVTTQPQAFSYVFPDSLNKYNRTRPKISRINC